MSQVIYNNKLTMEVELQCPVCHQLFDDPIILPCTHNVCFKCAETLVLKNGNSTNERSLGYRAGANKHEPVDVDKVSVMSETVFSDSDSGYSAGSGGNADNSDVKEQGSISVLAPTVSSLVNRFQSHAQKNAPMPENVATSSNGVNMPALPETISCLTCPVCHRTLFMDERGVAGLARHTLMNKIVGRFGKFTNSDEIPHKPGFSEKPETIQATAVTTQFNLETILRCQLCDNHPADPAVVRCVQCEVLYCASCRDQCHPTRGPLATHNLIRIVTSQLQLHHNKIEKANVYRRNKFQPLPNKPSTKNCMKLSSCPLHATEKSSLYCLTCRISICVQCQQDGKHKDHDVKAIGAFYKSLKSDLSGRMSALSNKARLAKDLIVQLRHMQAEIDNTSQKLEGNTMEQCNLLIEAVERKREEFIQRIAREKETKSKTVRDQLQQCTLKLKQTTGLLEYCIEIMKDNDVSAFLQISQSLTERVSCSEKQWNSNSLQPRVKSSFDLDLNSSDLVMMLEKMEFVQMKVPAKPKLRIEEDGTKSNTVTLSWSVPDHSQADGFKLEMDNGNNGPFKEVYCGAEHLCTVDGLHFNRLYRARARAFNKSGSSAYSDVLHLQTSEAASFHLNPKQAHEDLLLSNNNTTITSANCDGRVVLGDVGFSKGIHYWEFTIDRCDVKFNSAFGVAVGDVNRALTLGKDFRGWSLCIDDDNICLLHNNQLVERFDGIVKLGTRVGVLLDMRQMKVTFYINGRQQGSPMELRPSTSSHHFTLFYPAVSVNRNIQVSLQTGLRCSGSDRSPQFFRNRTQSIPDTSSFQKRAPSPYLTPPYSSDDRPNKGLPPPPPLRRSSSGSMSGLSTLSDPTPTASFKSFLQR